MLSRPFIPTSLPLSLLLLTTALIFISTPASPATASGARISQQPVWAAVVLGWTTLIPLEPEALAVTILHTNDLHAHYESFGCYGEVLEGGVARLKTAIDGIREEAGNACILLDAGDQFEGGSPYFTRGGAARVVADVMNEMDYDAMCIGNHEFDSGPVELAEFINLAEFPVLSANIDALSDPYLADKILPYELFFFKGERVAVIGLTTEGTAASSSPGPNVRFLDAISTAQQTVQELEEAGINKIIALTHLGYGRDLELATSVHGIDVIVGGHSHTRLDPYPTVTSSLTGEPVLIATAYEWGKQLGRLDVTFTAEGLVKSFDGETITIDESIAEDGDMLELLTTSHVDDIVALPWHVVIVHKAIAVMRSETFYAGILVGLSIAALIWFVLRIRRALRA